MASVQMRVSGALLANLLKLPVEAFTLTGAAYQPGTDTVIFEFDTVLGPQDATEISPVYVRENAPDPVRLAHIDWR